MSNNSFASNLKRGSMDQGRLTSSHSTTSDAPISNKRAFPGAGSPRSSPSSANLLQLPNANKQLPFAFSYSDSHVFNGPPTKRHCLDDMECEDKENNPTTTTASSSTSTVASVKQKRRESLGRNTNGNATSNNTNTSAIASYTTSPESAKLTSMMGGLSLGLGNLNFNKFSMDAINAPTVTVVSMQEDGTERKVSPRELLFSTLEKPKLKLPYHQDPARPEFNSITAATAANLLRGPFKQLYEKVIVVDCRYGYEYLGGHIGGALNYPEGKDIEVLFDTERKLASNHNDICFVFHCEFSSHRGPFGYKRFSELDKKFNGKDSGKTTFKEIYLLEKGYKAFFTEYKTLCDPLKYIQMDDPLFKDELQRIKAEKKNITETTKSRVSSGFASKSSVNLFANYKESPMPKSPMSMTSGSIFSPERSPLSRSMSSAMAGRRNEHSKSHLTSSVGNMGGNNFLFGYGAQQDCNGLFEGATKQHHQPASLPSQGNLFGPAFNNAQFTQQNLGTSPGSIFDDLDEVEENSPIPNANGLPFSGNASFSDLPFDALSLNDDHPPPPANSHHTNSNGKSQHTKSSHSSGDRTHTLSRKPSHRDRSERKGGSAENGGEGKSRKPSRARPTSLVYQNSSSFASNSNHLNQYSNATASPSAMNVIDDVISPFKGATHTPPSNLSHSASSSQSQLHLSQPLPRTSHSAPTSSRELFPRSNSSCSLTITNDNVAEDNVTKVKNYNFAIHNVSGNYSNQPVVQMQPQQSIANVSNNSVPVYQTRPVSALRDSKSDSEFRLQTRPLSKSISIPRHGSSPVISMDEDFSRPDTPFRPFESKETRSERESNASQQHGAKVMQHQQQQQTRPHSHSFSQSTGHAPLHRTNSCGGAEVMAMMNQHASANMNSGSNNTLNNSNGANLSGSTSSHPGSGSSSLASSTGSIFAHKSFATNPNITNRKKELIFDDKSGQDSMLRVRAGSMGDLFGARHLSSSSSSGSTSSIPGKENIANGRTLANSNQFGSGRREKTRAAISDRNGRPTETNWANKVFNSQRSSPTQIRAQSNDVTISQNSPTAYTLPNNLTTNQNSPTGGFQLNQSNSWSG